MPQDRAWRLSFGHEITVLNRLDPAFSSELRREHISRHWSDVEANRPQVKVRLLLQMSLVCVVDLPNFKVTSVYSLSLLQDKATHG